MILHRGLCSVRGVYLCGCAQSLFLHILTYRYAIISSYCIWLRLPLRISISNTFLALIVTARAADIFQGFLIPPVVKSCTVLLAVFRVFSSSFTGILISINTTILCKIIISKANFWFRQGTTSHVYRDVLALLQYHSVSILQSCSSRLNYFSLWLELANCKHLLGEVFLAKYSLSMWLLLSQLGPEILKFKNADNIIISIFDISTIFVFSPIIYKCTSQG